jgi:hypothetical protein
MAGAGYRTWTAGEVVTASNVQSYLQDQTVGVYAGTAARSSAILSPSEGQVSYRTDDDIVEVYNGTAWTPIAPTNSGLVHIKQEATGGAVASVSVNDVFSATYTHYRIITNLIGSTGISVNFRLRVAGADNSSTNYQYQDFVANNTSISSERITSATSWPKAAGRISSTSKNINILEVAFPFQTDITTAFRLGSDDASGGSMNLQNTTYGVTVTTSYTGFTLLASTGTINGVVDVYGYKVGS